MYAAVSNVISIFSWSYFMAPTVSSTVVTPPVPVPAHDATKIVIRQFRSEDLPQVIELFKEGMLCYPAQRENPHLLQFIDDSLKTDLMDIRGTYIELGGNYWIATPSDEPTLVVGMVGLEVKPNKEGELRRMSVKSSHRRFGVGHMLLSTLEQWAEEQQFNKIWLSTGSVMQKARDFYIRAGYIETSKYFLSEDCPIYGVVKLEKVLISSTS